MQNLKRDCPWNLMKQKEEIVLVTSSEILINFTAKQILATRSWSRKKDREESTHEDEEETNSKMFVLGVKK
jgi:hypothetical protein